MPNLLTTWAAPCFFWFLSTIYIALESVVEASRPVHETDVHVAAAKSTPVDCQKAGPRFDAAANSICVGLKKTDKGRWLECKAATGGIVRNALLDCLNGNLGKDNRSLPGTQGQCKTMASESLKYDPVLGEEGRSSDIVLWSGLSPEQQLAFRPDGFREGDRPPMVLQRTWLSSVLASDDSPTFDWDNPECKNALASFISGEPGTMQQQPREMYCKSPCGWHPSNTIKPWEAISQYLVGQLFRASVRPLGFDIVSGSLQEFPELQTLPTSAQAPTVYVLLQKWSYESVFAHVELATFLTNKLSLLQQLVKDKGRRMETLGKVWGSMDIRLNKLAKDKTNWNEPKEISCVNLVAFVRRTEATLRDASGMAGSEVCSEVRCYDYCDDTFTVKGGCVLFDTADENRQCLSAVRNFAEKSLAGNERVS